MRETGVGRLLLTKHKQYCVKCVNTRHDKGLTPTCLHSIAFTYISCIVKDISGDEFAHMYTYLVRGIPKATKRRVWHHIMT